MRCEALRALCCAPPSDVLSCESWCVLRKNLCAALTEPDLSVSPGQLHLFSLVAAHVLLINVKHSFNWTVRVSGLFKHFTFHYMGLMVAKQTQDTIRIFFLILSFIFKLSFSKAAKWFIVSWSLLILSPA